MPESIDLNADVGEGAGDDARLIPLVTSANIACGGHAGDDATMEAAVCAALDAGVAIGAHPGHVDRANFGRVEHPVTPGEAAGLVESQLEKLRSIAERYNAKIKYVKLHGALYHQVNRDAALAAAVISAIGAMPLLGPPTGGMRRAAETAGASYFHEAFVDRAYLTNGSLASRSSLGALLQDESAVVEQGLGIALRGEAKSLEGRTIKVCADSLCLHGDQPNSAGLAAALRNALLEAGISVRSFAF